MTKDLVHRVKLCMAQNMPKLVISLLLVGLMTAVIMSLSMQPVLTSIVSSSMTISSGVSLILSTIGFSTMQYVVQYGFFVLVFLLYTRRYAVLGHLFAGFRDFKRAAFFGIIFTGIFVLSLVAISVLLRFLLNSNIISMQIELSILMVILMVSSLIILCILYINFGFGWFLLYENSRISVKEALKKSIEITRHRKLEFVGFCFRCSSFFLPAAILSLIIMQAPMFIPNLGFSDTLLNLILSTASYSYLICAYISVMRFSIAFASWYVAYFDSPIAIDEIDKRIISLPDYHDLENDEIASDDSK